MLEPGEIELQLRNDGADPVEIKQAIVNDGFADFRQSDEEIGRLGPRPVTVEYPWIEGQAYEVMLLTATGGTVDHAIDVAVETPDADLGFYGLMALIGLYVGVIPVAIGMLWLPWLRSVDTRWLALPARLHRRPARLPRHRRPAGGHRAGRRGPGGVRRRGARLAGRGGGLPGAGGRRRLAARRGAARSARGGSTARRLPGGARHRLHNLGEGLAIGSAYAVGSLALGAALVVGFALHNTTEGLAIVAPAAREKVAVGQARRASACWPARPRCWAPGSAPRPSTRAWPG